MVSMTNSLICTYLCWLPAGSTLTFDDINNDAQIGITRLKFLASYHKT